MYSLYLEECAEKPAYFKINENSYRHMFCAQFNIGFWREILAVTPVQDAILVKVVKSTSVFIKLHLRPKTIDKCSATNNSEICYLTMDMQQTVPLPKLSTSKAFYLRQILFYHFGVHTITKAGDKPFIFT